MDARSIEILQQLQAEVNWAADWAVGDDGTLYLPKRQQLPWNATNEERMAASAERWVNPAINRNRWLRLIGELTALNPLNRDVKLLKTIYERPFTFHNTANKRQWLEAMLR